MASPIWYLAGAVALAVVYEKYLSQEEKARWESQIKMHHGEAGLLALLAGLATRSPRLAAVGAGLALHDINDINKWFTGDKLNS